MTRITEDHIENLCIELLEQEGYTYVHGAEIAHDGIRPERRSYADVVLEERLRNAIDRLNPSIPAHARQDAFNQVMRIHSPELLTNNEQFHILLTQGVNVQYQKNGDERGDKVWLIDFDNPLNNDFLVVNQFTIVEENNNKRPDVILFVNGLPLVVIELKNAGNEQATILSAFKQLDTYKHTIPSLFTFNAFNIISDGLEARAGTISSGISRYMAWKSEDGLTEASRFSSQMVTLVKGMLNKETLLDLIRHFIVFEESKKEDPQTGITSITTVKKLAAYHQYYAVNRAVESTLRATGYQKEEEDALKMAMHPPQNYGLASTQNQSSGDRKAGVVWHTQGSGKSLSMVFFTGKIVLALDNPTVLVITDRNDLDDQLFDTFAASRQLIRQDPQQVSSRDDLKDKLKVASGGVIFTTIQKFQPEEGNVYETLSQRENIVVIADEAHRTQYGFKAKTVDARDEEGHVVGKKVVYGFAKYMRDALPNATYHWIYWDTH
jgi:type I restriction enzyme R subunit